MVQIAYISMCPIIWWVHLRFLHLLLMSRLLLHHLLHLLRLWLLQIGRKSNIVGLNKMGDFRRGLISNALVMDLQLRIQSQGELMSLIHPDHWTCLLFLMQTPLTCCSWLKLLGGLMKKVSVSD